jgi:effector-binding domain-containing protein
MRPRLCLIAAVAAGVTAAGLASAQTPAPPAPPITGPAVPLPLKPGDAFGEEVTLPQRTIIYVEGEAHWDAAFETLLSAYKELAAYVEKHGITPAGPLMTVYTETDDTGFKFRAAMPVAAAPKEPPPAKVLVGSAPSGKALKFVHRGSYDAMDATYEAITNYLDGKQLEAKDVFIEEYESDILKAPENDLVVNIYVPVK